MAKYGLDYESLKKVNPRLIMCSVSGYGQDGPYAKFTSFDIIAQAQSGVMSMMASLTAHLNMSVTISAIPMLGFTEH